MRGQKLRSGVNWQGAINVKGIKHMGIKQRPGEFCCAGTRFIFQNVFILYIDYVHGNAQGQKQICKKYIPLILYSVLQHQEFVNSPVSLGDRKET
jgi:hypothetical protein